jgi:MATE family multidrug resistance protein
VTSPGGYAGAAAVGASAGALAEPAASALLAGDIRRSLFWLALPTLGEQLLGSMVAIVDAWLAGHLNRDAINAVGFSVYISWLVWMVFTAVGAGATAVVARSIGAGRRQEARTAVSQAVGVAVMAGAAATAIIVATAPLIAWLVWGNQGPAVPMRQFLQIEALGHVFVSITAIGIGCMRASGDTRTPLAIMSIVNIWNVAASTTLVHALGWGVRGIATGTASARAVGGLITLGILLSSQTRIRLNLARVWPRAAWVWRLVRIGLPAALETGSFWMVQVIFVTIIKHSTGLFTGEVNFAAHVIGLRVESLSYMPANAWAFAGGALMGQCLGAGMPDRARRVGLEACLQGGLLITLMGFVYFLAPAFIFRQFTTDPQVIVAGVPAMKMLAFIQPFLAVWIILGGCLRGSGDTRVPFFVTLACGLLIRLPVGYLGGIRLSGGLVGAWSGMCTDVAARSCLFSLRFLGGGWQRVRV